MVRKRTTQTASSKKRRAVMSIPEQEKYFKSLPSQFVAYYRKETVAMKQQEKKLSGALKKAETLASEIRKKYETLAKNKFSATAKKQYSAAKKGYDKIRQATKAMSIQLETIRKNIAIFTEKQAKYSAFSKEWTLFEKQWDKNPKIKTPQISQKKQPPTDFCILAVEPEIPVSSEIMEDVKDN